MKIAILIVASLFLMGCEPQTVVAPPLEPVPDPQRQEIVFSKPIVEAFEAKVIRIVDGDTVEVLLADNSKLKIRLESIDTPEAKQPFGDKAEQATGELLHGKTVEILKTGEDRWKRTIAFVVSNGVNASEYLIRAGYAWHYKQYSKDPELAALEIQAREARVGLWSGSEEPIPPWAWRKISRR